MAQDLNVDRLLDVILRSPEAVLMHKALARYLAEKQRIKYERRIVSEQVRYEKGIGTLESTGQPKRLWWKNN